MSVIMHDIKANKETSLSTMQMRIEGNEIVIMPGIYYNQDENIFELSIEKRFTIPLEAGHYEVWIYPAGEMKLEKNFHVDEPYIDMLLWVEMPEGAKSLADAEINFKRFLEVV